MIPATVDSRFNNWYTVRWRSQTCTWRLGTPSPREQNAESWMQGQAVLLPVMKAVENPSAELTAEIQRIERYLEEKEHVE